MHTTIQTTADPNNEFVRANIKRRTKHNSGATIKSSYLGVYWHKRQQKWHAYVWYNDKRKHLGCFDPTPEGERKAALAYDKVAAALGLPTNILKPKANGEATTAGTASNAGNADAAA